MVKMRNKLSLMLVLVLLMQIMISPVAYAEPKGQVIGKDTSKDETCTITVWETFFIFIDKDGNVEEVPDVKYEIEKKVGEEFTFEPRKQDKGLEFVGLYDSKGEEIVDLKVVAKKNMVLFPVFVSFDKVVDKPDTDEPFKPYDPENDPTVNPNKPDPNKPGTPVVDNKPDNDITLPGYDYIINTNDSNSNSSSNNNYTKPNKGNVSYTYEGEITQKEVKQYKDSLKETKSKDKTTIPIGTMKKHLNVDYKYDGNEKNETIQKSLIESIRNILATRVGALSEKDIKLLGSKIKESLDMLEASKLDTNKMIKYTNSFNLIRKMLKNGTYKSNSYNNVEKAEETTKDKIINGNKKDKDVKDDTFKADPLPDKLIYDTKTAQWIVYRGKSQQKFTLKEVIPKKDGHYYVSLETLFKNLGMNPEYDVENEELNVEITSNRKLNFQHNLFSDIFTYKTYSNIDGKTMSTEKVGDKYYVTAETAEQILKTIGKYTDKHKYVSLNKDGVLVIEGDNLVKAFKLTNQEFWNKYEASKLKKR